jgi:hypothetical protein
MDDTIRIRSGALNGRNEMPKLKYAEVVNGEQKGSELGFKTDEIALYIGTKNGNVRLCGANDITELTALIGGINARIDDIITRLEALEEPSE